MLSKAKYQIQQSKPTWRHKKNFKKLFSFKLTGKKSLEDTIESLARKGVIAKAALHAIQEQHIKGLAVTIKEGNAIYCLYPDGRMERISRDLPIPINIQQDILQIPD